ncbi:MAG: hypothetical protein IMF26_09690 [Candidatus Fermentithermobacillus carboniphilus]|uniref:Uncharacterized protein n=1 Tax=Candidatus Fermentithermobacillus carboniphilus TaxID=3085328 RepID=A0AAT9LB58_9FIRM|nr:MAG: hypothetical protein IMF26_09690 [Candidatus Fermentithermobacillus carboniphilus]
MQISTDLGVWIAAIATIGIISFAFKDNPLYRLVENVYVGVSAGHAIVLGWINIRDKAIEPMIQKGDWSLLVPVILGVLLYTRYSKKLSWLSRFPLALLVGIGTGLAIRGTIGSQIVSQINGTLLPLNSANNILIVLGTLGVLTYFFFSVEHRGALKSVSTFGRYVMMVSFGAAFGSTVMGRMALFIGRLQFLYSNWLGIIK